MNRNLVIVALVLGGIVLFASGFLAGFMVVSQFSFGPLAFRQQTQGYGPGMMGGGMMGQQSMMRGGMMGQGMMGNGTMGGMMGGYGYNQTPVAPNVPAAPSATANPPSDTKAPAPTAVPNAARRGTTGGGQTTGGLVAVSADGKTLPKDGNLPDNTAAQKVGNLNVTIAISPYPPASFQQGAFDITLADAEGKAITDAKVSLDLTMPAMWMPPSKPDAQHVGSGKYRASARWTMRGQWRIEVIITRGGEKQSAFFDVWL